jgi:hypothetical protein
LAFNQQTLDLLQYWCFNEPSLASDFDAASAVYFGSDDPRPVEYWPGTGADNPRERRLLGYFMFTWRLKSGEAPAAIAAHSLLSGRELEAALAAIAGTRYMRTMLKGVRGRSAYLEAEGKSHEVRSAQARDLEGNRNTFLAGYLVPVRGGDHWLFGPGWLMLGLELGKGARESMTSRDSDPVEMERLLQSRIQSEDDEPRTPLPQDESLDAAICS